MKNIKLNTSRKAGFSLMEMLIVIAIIGALAYVAIPYAFPKKTLPAATQSQTTITQHPDAIPHPNNSINYKSLSADVIKAYNFGAENKIFDPLQHRTIDAKLDAILMNSAECNAPQTLTAAIASKWITSKNLEKLVTITADGKLKLIENGTAEVTGPMPPKA